MPNSISPQFPITENFDPKTVANVKRSAFWSKLAYRNKLVAGILDRCGNRLKVPQALANYHTSSAKYRSLANLIPDNADDTGYMGDGEIRALLNYRNQLTDDENLRRSELRILYAKQIELLSAMFESSTNIKSMVNFGVNYGHVDSILARRFPNVEFVGIDRSPFTKAFNEVEFREIPNLRFFADDITQHVSANSYTDGIFFHARTAVVLNKPVLENIYRAAFDGGFEFIVGFEQFGVSRETFAPITFSLEDADSVHFRQFMFIHNYPEMLLKAGFRTEHPHPDFRILAFVARRDQSLVINR